LRNSELDVYTQEFKRTGFQGGGLNWYRCTTGGLNRYDLELFFRPHNRCTFLFYIRDCRLGKVRLAGALQQMQHKARTKMQNVHIIEGAGQWVQQEQPEQVTRSLLIF